MFGFGSTSSSIAKESLNRVNEGVLRRLSEGLRNSGPTQRLWASATPNWNTSSLISTVRRHLMGFNLDHSHDENPSQFLANV